MTRRFFPPERSFNNLDIKDLLEAREAFHIYLINMENVVATAIGRFRFRRRELRKIRPPVDASQLKIKMDAKPKTLQNTVSPPGAFPCILVFVNRWLKVKNMKDRPDQVVPRFLYLPDGRMIPTCVILVTKKDQAPPSLSDLNFPNEMLGGGYPIVTEVQGEQHLASIGCLVTDRDSVYALTNRHVVGEHIEGREPREVFTFVNGERRKIGVVDHKQVGKKPFTEVFRGWPGTRVYSTLDAGLVRIDELRYWTAQIFGVGEIGEPIDMHTDSISIDLIGCPVRAFGSASGKMIGQIQALFYRYKTVGGFDFVSDFLIGKLDKKPALATQPGDSGTVWCYDPGLLSRNQRKEMKETKEEETSKSSAHRLRPMALQWGGHQMMDRGGEVELSFALATSLTTICRELDVDIYRGWNIGLSEYWGKLGHYKIAAKACELLSNMKLRLLMNNNQEVIAFNDETLAKGKQLKIDSNKFVPLADVPDYVWRTYRKKDEANHFADMDEPGRGEFKGKTLLKLTEKPENVSITLWNRFYDSINTNYKRGALPFRVWQIYTEMVKFAKRRDINRFVCAAGILAHYVGDACQPLHVSYLHHGEKNRGEEKVHSYYESEMVDRRAGNIIAGVNAELKGRSAKPEINGGKEAAISVIELMRSTFETLPPPDIIKAYRDSQNGDGRMEKFFSEVGERTMKCMAKGCLRLASIWESAWREGKGQDISKNKLVRVPKEDLMRLYNDDKFLEAFRLQDPNFEDALRQATP
jgi:hypothetical protein